MQQKVVIGTATLYHGDCMNLMKTLDGNSFDLAIVDPPYGVDGNSHRKNDRRSIKMQATKFHSALWDQKRPSIEYFRQLRRVSNDFICWGGNHLMDLIVQSDDKLMSVNKTYSPSWLVWDKHTGTNNFSDCELAYTTFRSSVRKFSYPWNGMIQGFHGIKSKNEKRIHPTQKPIALYEWILTNYAEKGHKILDTHFGSGSSAIAAIKLGLDFVGTEIDKIYFNDAIRRIEKSLDQKDLFFGESQDSEQLGIFE